MATTTFTPSMLRGAGTRGIPEIPAGSSFSNTYSLAFDGVDDYVKAPLDGTSTGGILAASDSDVELTISFWFYMDGSQNLKGIFQWAEKLISLSPMVLIQTNGASIRTYVDGGYRHTSGLTTNAWHHYATTRTASTNTWQGYIDGASVFTMNDGGAISARSNASDLYFGVGYNGYLNGNIDEVAVWNSVQDVATIYNSGVPNDLSSLSPLAWYRFEEGSGTTAIDSGTGGNNGTISGATYSTNVPT